MWRSRLRRAFRGLWNVRTGSDGQLVALYQAFEFRFKGLQGLIYLILARFHVQRAHDRGGVAVQAEDAG
jgi:hypothetical protein